MGSVLATPITNQEQALAAESSAPLLPGQKWLLYGSYITIFFLVVGAIYCFATGSMLGWFVDSGTYDEDERDIQRKTANIMGGIYLGFAFIFSIVVFFVNKSMRNRYKGKVLDACPKDNFKDERNWFQCLTQRRNMIDGTSNSTATTISAVRLLAR